MKVVEVRWDDAWVDTRDISVAKAKALKPVRRTTIGFLIAETEDAVVLCTDKFEDDDRNVNTPMVIPWGMVVGYWEYR